MTFYRDKKDKKITKIYWILETDNKNIFDVEEWRDDGDLVLNDIFVSYFEAEYYQITEKELKEKIKKQWTIISQEDYVYPDYKLYVKCSDCRGRSCGAGLFRVNPKWIKALTKCIPELTEESKEKLIKFLIKPYIREE